MKKLLAIILAALMMMTAMTAFAEEETNMNWAYGAMPLNNGNVGTIYYTAAYYELEGIVNPTNPEYAPYTAEEIAAIVDGAVEGAEGYRLDGPAGALIGMTVADTETDDNEESLRSDNRSTDIRRNLFRHHNVHIISANPVGTLIKTCKRTDKVGIPAVKNTCHKENISQNTSYRKKVNGCFSACLVGNKARNEGY